MIQTKEEYRFYLAQDLQAHKLNRWRWFHRYRYPVVHYQRLLRKTEYYANQKPSLWQKANHLHAQYRLLQMGMKLGFSIGRNVFGPKLRIAHYGSVVVHKDTRIGEGCVIHSAVNIGIKDGECPVIGKNVYIGPGAKLFGGITIGDNVKIGANAVVCKDVPSDVSVGGVPAKVLRPSRAET